jgi:NNP family nitrate/nitrite transporter-like MFS transporter
MPLIVVAVLGALLRMDSLSQASNDTGSYARAVREPQTWVMSILYIGTFGSFIGMAFSLPLVIKNTFPEFLAEHSFIATYLAGLGFTGALVGSLSRPLGGWLSDRVGGAKVTLWCFIAMAGFTLLAIAGVRQHSFPLFFGAYMVLFGFIGMANGSTYRMIPSIFAALGRQEARETGLPPDATVVEFKRRAAAALGIIGAVGAFGGFLVQVVLREASLGVSALVAAAETPAEKLAVAAANADWAIPALWAFIGAYVVFAAITWFFYVRKSFAVERVPSLAYASV